MNAKQAAQERLQAAADHIEKAQHELEAACRALCAIRGAGAEFRRISKLTDLLQMEWHQRAAYYGLNTKAELDHEPKEDEHSHKGCCT